jgi:hypothetical protein
MYPAHEVNGLWIVIGGSTIFEGSLDFKIISQFVLSNCPSVLGSIGKIDVPFIFNSILGLTKTPKFLL